MVESGRSVAESRYRIVFDGGGPLVATSAEGRSIAKIGKIEKIEKISASQSP